jgi:hypothetical protein
VETLYQLTYQYDTRSYFRPLIEATLLCSMLFLLYIGLCTAKFQFALGQKNTTMLVQIQAQACIYIFEGLAKYFVEGQ